MTSAALDLLGVEVHAGDVVVYARGEIGMWSELVNGVVTAVGEHPAHGVVEIDTDGSAARPTRRSCDVVVVGRA